jgi:hypothetical protein
MLDLIFYMGCYACGLEFDNVWVYLLAFRTCRAFLGCGRAAVWLCGGYGYG